MAGRRRWGGPLEMSVVGLLTVGTVVLGGLAGLTGVLLAWLSPRWTRLEKGVATAAVGLAVLASWTMLIRAGATSVLGSSDAPPVTGSTLGVLVVATAVCVTTGIVLLVRLVRRPGPTSP